MGNNKTHVGTVAGPDLWHEIANDANGVRLIRILSSIHQRIDLEDAQALEAAAQPGAKPRRSRAHVIESIHR